MFPGRAEWYMLAAGDHFHAVASTGQALMPALFVLFPFTNFIHLRITEVETKVRTFSFLPRIATDLH
jgi:hypothetical protein